MKFVISLTPSARDDIEYFRTAEQRQIVAAIKSFLQENADRESRRRKQLRPNKLTPWELKASHYRVFYRVENGTVRVVAVGYKRHNDLYIRGEKVEL